MADSTWVDFKLVKATVPIAGVMSHYGLKLKPSGRELRGRCPFHSGGNPDSFHANPDKNVFKCFSCKAAGNVLDFVAQMEHSTVRDAALKLQAMFLEPTAVTAIATGEQGSAPAVTASEAAANKPLTFTLQGVDTQHGYLAERGIEQETAEYFGCGYFGGRGSMSGRVVFGIHNAVGELVAYAGRSIDGAEPKYKFPSGFTKSQELFNFHRAVKAEGHGRVVVVEGFFDCLTVHQAGFPGVVALMGCSASSAQQELLCSAFYEIVLMLDGDEAGRAAATQLAGQLAWRNVWVRIVDVGQGRQPDGLSRPAIHELLGGI